MESRWERDFPHLSRQALGPTHNGYRFFPRGKERPGRDADHSPPWVVYLLYMLYFKMSCVYCCELSCVYCCSCLVCIVVTLCVFVALCVYCCFYFRSWTAGYKSVFGRSRDRPPRHRFCLVSLCLKANTEIVPKIPNCHYMLLMQPSRLKFISNQFHILYACEITTATG